MALSNRDRVGRALELLAEGLDPFLARVLAPETPEGHDWTVLLAARDARKARESGGPPRTTVYDRRDPQAQLRVLNDNITSQLKPRWYPFDEHLSRAEKSLASELAEVRNGWAHAQPFSTDDAYRALDTTERLLRAVGAPQQADEVRQLRVDLRRVTAAEDVRRVVTTAPDIATAGLLPWREVLQPHDDVRSGNFRAAEFAADLHTVALASRGGLAPGVTADGDYTDPIQFFGRTYLTDGLTTLLSGAVARVCGDMNAAPVVNLQTNFGGGKTHSMLALWHIVSGRPLIDFPQDVQDLLHGSGLDEVRDRVRRVALVGNHLSASGIGGEGDEPLRRTLWGELAWQLGGAEGYAIVAAADRTSTNPAGVLDTLLQRCAPAVILIDEWVAYARQLFSSDDRAGGSFDTQFTFAQTLTEAVKRTPGVLLVISIPASSDSPDGVGGAVHDEEVGGRGGREALAGLQNVVRRVADQWRPASAEESFEIVRRRLFTAPHGDAHARITATARAVVQFYRDHAGDFPSEVRDQAYVERIRHCYPLHPELFDRLYTDWSTLERFQRTRGVLRLLNTVVNSLWKSADPFPLIMPGSIPLSDPAVMTELTQYLEDQWKVVIDADVDGDTCTPGRIDDASKALFGSRQVTRRLARTVFFGATPTIKGAHKGLDRSRVFLGTALPGDVPGNFHSALAQLADQATYYYSLENRSWFLTQANTTRTARDHAERLQSEDVWAELLRRLKTQRRGDPRGIGATHVTDEPGEVPDTDEVRLVLLHPRATYDRKRNGASEAGAAYRRIVEQAGSGQRTCRNMVVALAADVNRMAELDAATRDLLAWRWVYDNADKQLDLTAQQKEQARDRRDRADVLVDERIVATYHWVLSAQQQDATQPFDVTAHKAEGTAKDLVERAVVKLGQVNAVSVQRAAPLIAMDLRGVLEAAWEPGHLAFGTLWTYYVTYPYLARLRNRNVLVESVHAAGSVIGWEQATFALAETFDEAADRYVGLWLPTDDGAPPPATDSLLLVRPDRALAQRRVDLARAAPAASTAAAEVSPPVSLPDSSGSTSTVVPGPAPKVRFHGSKQFDPATIGKQFAQIATEVIAQLAAVDGVQLDVRLDIQAVAPNGFDEAKRRAVSENAATLKLDDHGFEER